MVSRRSLFGGLAALIAAPAIVRATSIMPVSAPKELGWTNHLTFDGQPIFFDDPIDDAVYTWTDFNQIVEVTLRAHQSQMVDAVSQHNALFSRFKSMALPA